jgi:hypothetical protein
MITISIDHLMLELRDKYNTDNYHVKNKQEAKRLVKTITSGKSKMGRSGTFVAFLIKPSGEFQYTFDYMSPHLLSTIESLTNDTGNVAFSDWIEDKYEIYKLYEIIRRS